MRVLRLFSGMVLLAFFAGCVSKPVEVEEHAPRLAIAQNSDGQVSISWDSEPGRIYTIYYQAEKDGDWKALRSAYQIPGTGDTLTAYDRVNPNRPLRRYRLLPEDI